MTNFQISEADNQFLIRYKKFLSQPAVVREAVFSPQTADFLGQLAEKYALSESKLSVLADLVGSILIGSQDLNNLENALFQSLKIDQNQGKIIGAELRKNIFDFLKDYIKKVSLADIQPKRSLAEVKLKMQEVRARGNLRPQIQETTDITLPNQPNVVKPSITQPNKPFFSRPVPQNQKSIDSVPRPLKKDEPDIIIQEKEEMDLNSPAKQLGL